MKRLIPLLLAIALLLPAGIALASDISGALYKIGITITNSGTATTNVSTVATISTPNLIAGRFANDGLTDVAMRNAAGADVPFMPGWGSNSWAMFVPSIGANAQLNYTLYTDSSTGGLLRYFPGNSGMTSPDVASMELGNNFEVEQSGCLDVSQVGANLVKKNESFRTYVQAAGSIRSALYGGQPTSATTNAYGVIGTSIPVTLPGGVVTGDLILVIATWSCDTASSATVPGDYSALFNVNTTGGLGLLACYKVATGAETTMTLTLSVSHDCEWIAYRFPAGTYTGVPVSSNTGQIYSSAPNPPSLTAWASPDSTYYIACYGIGQGFIGITAWPANYGLNQVSQYRYSGVTSVGIAAASRVLVGTPEDPGTFTVNTADSWYAATIGVRGYFAESKTVTAIGVSSGEHVIKTTADATSLKIFIDGTEQGSVALAGAAAIDNANTWTFCESAAMPYVEYSKVTVGGTLRQNISVQHWPITGSTVTNGTGIATGSPVSLGYGGNTITVTQIGTFTVFLPTGIRGTATSGTTTVSGSPQALVEGSNTVTTTTATGTFSVATYPIFRDASGNSNHATPSFRTNTSDADVTAAAISFQPITEAKAPASSLAQSSPWVTDVPPITGNFTSANTTTTTYPGAAIVAALAAAASTPKELPLNLMAGFVILALSMSVGAALRRNAAMSLLVKGFVVALLMGIAVALKVFDFWMIVLFAYFGITLAMASTDPRWG